MACEESEVYGMRVILRDTLYKRAASRACSIARQLLVNDAAGEKTHVYAADLARAPRHACGHATEPADACGRSLRKGVQSRHRQRDDHVVVCSDSLSSSQRDSLEGAAPGAVGFGEE